VQQPRYYGAVAFAAVVVGALAVTNQSLWIDEGSAALKAMAPSLGDWWHNLRVEGNSNLQLPGQLFYLWVWAKIFGVSEIALRASNLPFFVGGVVALAWGANVQPRQTATTLICLTNAFLWYYLSEARPYVFLFGFAALTAACLFRFLTGADAELRSRPWLGLFCLGLVGLCAASLIAVPWALGALAAVIFWCGPRAIFHAALRGRVISLLTAVALAGLGLYYFWTMQLGARASAIGRTSLPNLGFILYELCGLSGLGPGRLQLRVDNLHALENFLPSLVPGLVAVLVLAIAGFFALRGAMTRRSAIFFLLAVAGPFLIVFAAGVLGQMRLLGRHLTPLLPYLLAWMGAGLAALFSGSIARRTLGLAAVVVLLASSIEIRVAPRHRRDDYRTAVTVARKEIAAGHRVWWLGDMATARYYGLALGSPGLVTQPEPPVSGAPPEVVILSKPDLYDARGEAGRYLALHGFKIEEVLPAFQIWRQAPRR